MSSPAQNREIIAAFLRAESTLVLATASADGQPASTPLFYLADEALNLYFLSSPGSQHGQNLLARSQAAASVYRQTMRWQEICGIQMRGSVTAITQPDQRKALLKLYRDRFQLGALFAIPIRRSTLYAFRPDWFRFIDNSRHFGYKFEVSNLHEGH
jgi:hypothetical protein